MRIDINLMFPLGRRYGSPTTSAVTMTWSELQDGTTWTTF